MVVSRMETVMSELERLLSCGVAAHEKGPEIAAMLLKVTTALRVRIEDTCEEALQDDLDDNHVTAAEALLREIGWKR